VTTALYNRNMLKDYYRTLEVHREASGEVIDKAYKALTMKHHPDKNPGNGPEATARMTEIIEAYTILSDPGKRRMYDMTRPPDMADAVREVGRIAKEKDLGKVFWSTGLFGVAKVLKEEIKRRS